MSRFSALFIVAALVAACAPTTPHSANPAPGVPPGPAAPDPITPPRPAPAPVAAPDADPACARDAAPIYVETVSAIGAAPRERLTILASGAWTHEVAGAGGALGEADHGCLSADMRDRFAGAVRAADFTPPPPPEIRCLAVSDTAIEFRDVAGDRTAHATGPCGDAASADVADLSTAARMLTVEPQRATAIPLPPKRP